MNVYDFDKTIFDGDSTVGFLKYIFVHEPKKLIYLPAIGIEGLLFALKIMKKQTFKERLFTRMFTHIDTQRLLTEFWELNYHKVKNWYHETQKADDIIISASPLFIVKPCCEKLGIKEIYGSPVDMHTGKYHGKNCHGEEKVRVFYDAHPSGVIDDFYSDSHSDDPLALLAHRAFLVSGERLSEWNFD